MSTSTFCVQCGPMVTVDEDGCCATCGSTAIGPWASKAVNALARLRKFRRLTREARKAKHPVQQDPAFAAREVEEPRSHRRNGENHRSNRRRNATEERNEEMNAEPKISQCCSAPIVKAAAPFTGLICTFCMSLTQA